jgi:hypothetical protein
MKGNGLVNWSFLSEGEREEGAGACMVKLLYFALCDVSNFIAPLHVIDVYTANRLSVHGYKASHSLLVHRSFMRLNN